MDIHHLKVFASVFKNKSFSKASEELYLTQPTISNHIKALEDELECNLFDRLGRTIIPTKEAEVLYNLSTELIEKVIKKYHKGIYPDMELDEHQVEHIIRIINNDF